MYKHVPLLLAASMGLPSSPRWAPSGTVGEALYFGELDEPDAETRHLLSFVTPVLEDSTHLSTFYFECAEACGHAAAALGVGSGA